ncbi:aminotransferase class I/II-fold pyridoxal phosphate-dependent enzyme [bacterium]|nr:aminotransferase class I/II-fold pyridoxal phosphate-dependent enzyme [bacterium]
MFERTRDLRLSIIKQMELKASKYTDVISLAQGIPSFDTPDCVKRRVERALSRGVVAKYSLSPGLPELRELIEISLAREKMYYDWQKEILVTAGSIEGITASILAITTPGDEIIIPEPTYTSYREVIRLAGCKPVFVSLNEEKGWTFELEQYKKAITEKTKAIFYCNPNNPTGTIYTKNQLMDLAKLAEKHDLFLISDEVYKDFIYGKKEFFSLAEIPELRKRVIRIFSFSKAYAMTGWRIAYLHSDEENVKEIIKVHDALVTCAPVISQYGAMGALEMADDDIKKFNTAYEKRRNITCGRLKKLSNEFSFVLPNSSYYVFPKIKGNEKNSWEFSNDLLDKAQVAVVPGMAFGPSGEGHIRISFGRSEDDIEKAFDRIDKYFKK